MSVRLFGRTSVLSGLRIAFAAGTLARLTLTGNEITDATRTANLSLGTTASGQMIDTRVADGSIRAQRAATNLHGRGQCDAVIGARGWAAQNAGATVSVDPTVAAPFSPQSVKCVCDGTTANQGVAPISATGLAAAAGVLTATSVLFKGVPGASYTAKSRWSHTDATVVDGNVLTFNATGAWQLLIPDPVAVGVGKTGDLSAILVRVNGTRAETFNVAHGMLEVGVTTVAPYVATSGGNTATHAAGRPTAPTSLLSPLRGTVVMRIRHGFSSNDGSARVLWALSDGTTSNRLSVVIQNNGLSTRVAQGGVAYATGGGLTGYTYAVGDGATVSFRWSPSVGQGLALNAGTFQAGTAPGYPGTWTPSLFELGAQISANYIDSDMLWAAAFSDALTDADHAWLHAELAAGREPSTSAMIERGMPVTAMFPFGDTSYSLPRATYEVAADTKYASRYNLANGDKVAKGSVYLDGLGAGAGLTQALRLALYDATDTLVATSNEVLVARGQQPGWVDFAFPTAGDLALLAGDYHVTVLAGPSSGIVRLYGSDPRGMGGKFNADTYSDGSAATFGAATPLTSDFVAFVQMFAAYTAPDETDIYYSRLPFADGQATLAKGGPVGGSQRVTALGWHDTFQDAELGSNALVRENGPLAGYLGERVRITTHASAKPRAVFAYVHGLLPEDSLDDLSVTRLLFSRLSNLSDDTTPVTVEVIA